MELFKSENLEVKAAHQPLALHIGPKDFGDFVGQKHLLGPEGPLGQAAAGRVMVNAIFFGPPGCGKTALARLISKNKNTSSYVEFSCVTTGIAKIKEAMIQAGIRRQNTGKATMLILDEIHHLNRTQQDVLLPYMENGDIAAIGLTTENPFFYIHRAVLSRALVFEFKPLEAGDIKILLDRACHYYEKEGIHLELSLEGEHYIIQFANGDARRLLNAVEFLAKLREGEKSAASSALGPAELARLLGQKLQMYDKNQDSHYNTISAFIKSMRGSDPDAVIYWMAKMLEGGEDPRFIARRIVIAASEDVGNADPLALVVAQSAFGAVEMLGLPEGAIPLAHAAIYVACAPKSNACYLALQRAQEEVRECLPRQVPSHLRDGSTPGREEGYLYPHDYPDHFVKQTYIPNPKIFYQPTGEGMEAKIRERLKFLWQKT